MLLNASDSDGGRLSSLLEIGVMCVPGLELCLRTEPLQYRKNLEMQKRDAKLITV